MSRKKLTLSVDERLTRRAKSIAEERETSVSRLVETFFTLLEEAEPEGSENVGAREEETSAGNGDSRPSGPAYGEDEADASPLADYEPSEWTRRWRGAFKEQSDAERTSYPDNTEWEDEVLAEEISKKHA